MSDTPIKRPAGTRVSGKVISRKMSEWELSMKEYSQQIPDPYKNVYNGGGEFRIIAPPFTPENLQKLPNENNTLLQCIDAMKTNVEGFGHRLEYIGPDGEEESEQAQLEKSVLKDFLKTPNNDYSFIEMRKRFRDDIETLGYGALEVIRDQTGAVQMVYHIEAHTLRLTVKDEEDTKVEELVKRGEEDVSVVVRKRFRRFVQRIGSRTVYFKEYGDPRSIDPVTGHEKELNFEDQATEIIFHSRYVAGHLYGMPRWINNLPAILGSRESELTNLNFFKDNAIPPFAIMVSGGMLTEASMEDIEQRFNGSRGQEMMHRALILEAQANDDDTLEEGGSTAPRIEIKPLMADRQNDALFQEYDENNQQKIRSCFRLPPIFVGRSDDYTRATAQSSLETAESQVFSPERNDVDDIINAKLFVLKDRIRPKFWRFRSNPARLVGSESVIEAMKMMDEMGAMTPNNAIEILNELMNLNRPKIDEQWADYPFEMVKLLVNKGEVDLTTIDQKLGEVFKHIDKIKKAA